MSDFPATFTPIALMTRAGTLIYVTDDPDGGPLSAEAVQNGLPLDGNVPVYPARDPYDAVLVVAEAVQPHQTTSGAAVYDVITDAGVLQGLSGGTKIGALTAKTAPNHRMVTPEDFTERVTPGMSFRPDGMWWASPLRPATTARIRAGLERWMRPTHGLNTPPVDA